MKITRLIRDYRTFKYLQGKGAFNDQWYLSRYPDVRHALEKSSWHRLSESSLPLLKRLGTYMTSPLNHYLRYGYMEGRNPTDNFDTSDYCRKYCDFNPEKINPFYHYIRYGKQEGRFATSDEEQNEPNAKLFKPFYPSLSALLYVCRQGGGTVFGENLLDWEHCLHPVLLISHDFSNSEAVNSLLKTALELKRLGKQIIFTASSDAPLRLTISAQGIPVLIHPDILTSGFIERAACLFDFIIVGSILNYRIIRILNGIPASVLWRIFESDAESIPMLQKDLPQELMGNIRVCHDDGQAEKVVSHIWPDVKLEQWSDTKITKFIEELDTSHYDLLPCPETVSVIIPTYQAGQEFPLLLKKIQFQRNIADIEIVIVDSGSTDGTVENARAAGAVVIEIPHEKFSHSEARNLGAEKSHGKYLILTVQDAIPLGSLWISKLLQPILKKEAVAVSCPQIPRYDSELQSIIESWERFHGMKFYKNRITKLPARPDFISMCKQGHLDNVACAIEREIVLNFRYRGNFAEDMDMGFRLLQAGYHLAMIGTVGVVHSHNRSPFYLFRRQLITQNVMVNQYPDYPLRAEDYNTTVNRILTAYIDLNSLVNKLEDLSTAENWEFLLQRLSDLSSHILKHKHRIKYYLPMFRFPSAGTSDSNFDAIMNRLWQDCQKSFRYDDTMFRKLTDTVQQELRVILFDYVFTRENLNIELRKVLIAHFANLCGESIAGYISKHPDDNITLLSHIFHENQFGV